MEVQAHTCWVCYSVHWKHSLQCFSSTLSWFSYPLCLGCHFHMTSPHKQAYLVQLKQNKHHTQHKPKCTYSQFVLDAKVGSTQACHSLNPCRHQINLSSLACPAYNFCNCPFLFALLWLALGLCLYSATSQLLSYSVTPIPNTAG